MIVQLLALACVLGPSAALFFPNRPADTFSYQRNAHVNKYQSEAICADLGMGLPSFHHDKERQAAKELLWGLPYHDIYLWTSFVRTKAGASNEGPDYETPDGKSFRALGLQLAVTRDKDMDCLLFGKKQKLIGFFPEDCGHRSDRYRALCKTHVPYLQCLPSTPQLECLPGSARELVRAETAHLACKVQGAFLPSPTYAGLLVNAIDPNPGSVVAQAWTMRSPSDIALDRSPLLWADWVVLNGTLVNSRRQRLTHFTDLCDRYGGPTDGHAVAALDASGSLKPLPPGSHLNRYICIKHHRGVSGPEEGKYAFDMLTGSHLAH